MKIPKLSYFKRVPQGPCRDSLFFCVLVWVIITQIPLRRAMQSLSIPHTMQYILHPPVSRLWTPGSGFQESHSWSRLRSSGVDSRRLPQLASDRDSASRSANCAPKGDVSSAYKSLLSRPVLPSRLPVFPSRPNDWNRSAIDLLKQKRTSFTRLETREVSYSVASFIWRFLAMCCYWCLLQFRRRDSR